MDILQHLNQEQKKAVTHEKGPLLIIAGAGTGKTTVITEKVKYLVLQKNISPSQILALTFTEKAAKEMTDRVDKVMPYGYTEIHIATFHSFCDQILRADAFHIGLNPDYKLATEAQVVLFLRKNLFKFELDYFRPLGNPTKFLEGMLQHFDRLRDEDVTPTEYLRYAQEIKNQKSKIKNDEEDIKKTLELAHAYQTFEELKIKEGIMDFPNLISAMLKLFRTRKNVLDLYQNQFKYILIDEFQDTNYAQIELAKLLAAKHKNIIVVGDDDQAIYRWRGAAISNMVQFRENYPDCKIITLTKNYRSTKAILDTSYKLIQFNNPDRLEVKEHINKQLSSEIGKSGDMPEFIFAERVEDEAEKVANIINELTSGENPNYQLKDIAILVRANDHSQSFARAFDRMGILYQFLGPAQLFLQEEIKDLIAYLKILYDFEDSASLYRVFCMGIFNISSQDVSLLLSFAKWNNLTLFEALEKVNESKVSKDGSEKLKKLQDIIKEHINKVPKETAGQILYDFLEKSGILSSFVTFSTHDEERKAKNVAAFFDKLRSFEAEFIDASVFAVVDWIDLSMQMGESPMAGNIDWQENNAVNILTIHSSKGLEFPVIFLVNLVSQRFPTRERRDPIPIPQDLVKDILPVGEYHVQEERRLFYVGMTRAKEKLFLTAAKYYGEGKREKKISQFVYEALGAEILEKTLLAKDSINQLSLFEWQPRSTMPDQPIQANGKVIPITYLSYSQLQTFEMCPLHYKLRYLLHVPVAKPAAAPNFGTSIHETLRKFYRAVLDGDNIKLDDIETFLKTSWIKQGYQDKEHEKLAYDRARKLLQRYLEENFNKLTLPVALETPFAFSIKNGTNYLKVGGRIDRVDKTKNGIEIIDYKTGNTMLSQKDVEKNLQLTLYALAATKIKDEIFDKKPEEIVLTLHYLEQGIKLSTTRTLEQLREAEEEILKKANEIANSDFLCKKSIFCKTCEYSMLCSTVN